MVATLSQAIKVNVFEDEEEEEEEGSDDSDETQEVEVPYNDDTNWRDGQACKFFSEKEFMGESEVF